MTAEPIAGETAVPPTHSVAAMAVVPAVSVERDLPFAPEAPALARRFITEHAQGLPPALREDAILLSSELVTNAVRYGRPALVLQLRVSALACRVWVEDRGDAMPVIPGVPAAVTAVSGRGLLIVDAVANKWGVAPNAHGPGKAVWFELAR